MSRAALMVMVLMRRWLRYYGRAGSVRRQRLQKKPVAEKLAKGPNYEQPLMDAPDELLRWNVEMHEIARTLKGELDSKIRVLNALVLQSRREADRLERLIEQARPKT